MYDDACSLLSKYAVEYGLRTLDSLQLATFLNYCEREKDCFVCADKKLSAVVECEGYVQFLFEWFFYSEFIDNLVKNNL